jgi:hypothetical protein
LQTVRLGKQGATKRRYATGACRHAALGMRPVLEVMGAKREKKNDRQRDANEQQKKRAHDVDP